MGLQHSELIVWTFAAYIALMLAIGWLGYRGTENLADYLLGGRRLGRWVTALSAEASDMSGWLLLGLPGYAYLSGFEAGWIALGLLAGTYLNWRFVAARLRVHTQAVNAVTLPEFFERRFDDSTGVLRVAAAFCILLFFTIYTSSGLVASGRLFEAVFGIDYGTAVLTGALVVLVYTVVGGFLAVSWTDLVQGTLMFFALVAVPVVALQSPSGPVSGLETLRGQNPSLLDPFSDASGEPLTVLAVLSLLGWGLGYFGQPHILARFMAVRDVRELPAARRIAVTWVTLTLAGAVLTGVLATTFPAVSLDGADTETVFIHMVTLLFHPLLAGVCLAAILAAIMSTADSQLLVASSALSEDFYKAYLRPLAGSAELVWAGRAAVFIMAVVAVSLAMDPDSRVLDLVAYAWAGFGAAFGPVLLLSLYWRRMNRNGALAGMLTGGLTVLLWKPLEGGPYGLFELYELVPGFLVSGVAGWWVSRMTSPPGPGVVDRLTGLR